VSGPAGYRGGAGQGGSRGVALGLVWTIRSRQSAADRLVWTVRVKVSAARVVAWQVRARVGSTVRLAWSDRARVVSTTGLAWSVQTRVAATTGLVWSVAAPGSRVRVSGATALAWSVDAPAVADLPAGGGGPPLPPWKLPRTRTMVATSLSWTVLRRERSVRPLAWSVEAPPPPPEPKPPPVKRPPVRRPQPKTTWVEPTLTQVSRPKVVLAVSDDEDALAAILAALV
jgi:hypothetical protein